MCSDENGRKQTKKTLFLLPFLYFLVETGSGLENAGLETESGYADARKQKKIRMESQKN
jgi:hypothetical protein